MKADSAFFILPSSLSYWLPDMDLNHDKQIQSLLCYRYTIGQAGACSRVILSFGQSSQGNPKSEVRNPKEVRSPKTKAFDQQFQGGNSGFGFPSDFGFRHSDFKR